MSRRLPPGVYVQIYRRRVPGATPEEQQSELARELDRYAQLGVVGVMLHAFPRSLPGCFLEESELVTQRGLACYGSFGLDVRQDDDGTDLTPSEKGEALGQVAGMAGCDGVVLDMEGRWEVPERSKQEAIEMGEVFRAMAPDVLAVDQPWMVPTRHWLHFPWEETARYVDVRAPQVYVNDFIKQYGADRYRIVWDMHLTAWAQLAERLAAQGLSRPKAVSIQGYDWVLSDLINCLLCNPTIILWCEPFPTPETVRGLQAVRALHRRGFTGPGAVQAFQAAHHMNPDGVCGPRTLEVLGV